MLIDFTPYFGQQNEIFAGFWETYKLDSISGQWDYVEPALFGYAAGKMIESFSTFHREHHNIIAQFHEWMTGTGILYLKKTLHGLPLHSLPMQQFLEDLLQVIIVLSMGKWRNITLSR